jgi:AraC-like DNA-binding protein
MRETWQKRNWLSFGIMTVYIAGVPKSLAHWLRSLGATYQDGHVIGSHGHDWGQLVYAGSGAVQVTAEDGHWLVPPARAVWIPPRREHQLKMRGVSALKTIYMAPERCRALPSASKGIEVTPFLRELILHIVAIGTARRGIHSTEKFGEILEILLVEANALPFAIRMPADARARRAVDLIQQSLGVGISLSQLAAQAGASVRTLQRLFLKETGVHLAEWRQTACMIAATAKLLDGASVTQAGLGAGYATTSSFISAFRKRTGCTPLEYRNRIAPRVHL